MKQTAKNIILTLTASLVITAGFGAGKDKGKDKDKPCPGSTYSSTAVKHSLKDVISDVGDKIANIHIGKKKEGPVFYTGISKHEAKKFTERNREATINMLHSYEENETFMGYATDDSVPTVVAK